MTEQMKPSGIAWIGDIPHDWECKRFRFCGDVQYGYPFNSDYFSNEETGFPLIRIRDITSGEIATYYEGAYPDEYIVKSGDVLVGMDGDFNVRVWANCDALLNQRCCRVLDSHQISKRFMAYYLPHYLKVINDLTWSTTVKHLLADDITNIYVSFPKISEQQAIADFLDDKCAKIDGIVADIEEQIETLQKYKKFLITETVTKGLDKSVPMKDSGIEWIGKIPLHWSARRLKYVMNNFDSQRKPIEAQNRSQDGDILYDYYGASGAIDKIDDYIFDETSLLIGEDGANLVLRHLPLIYIATGKYWVNNHAHILRPKPENDLYFMAHQMEIIDYSLFITGSAQPKLSQENLNNVMLVVPPLEDQQKIASFLNQKTTVIDEIIEKKQQQLNTIQQHKKSLIYEYVTGKKRVTEVN